MASKGTAAIEDTPRTPREIIQKKFLDEVIGVSPNWKVLVMDETATRVISAVLTMYDIMERRVTLVEQLMKNRQPFVEMDSIYLISPTVEAVRKLSQDFESRQKHKYGAVHLFFIDAVSPELFAMVQSNAFLVSKIKTFKELSVDFLMVESNVFHLDSPYGLEKLFGSPPEASYPALLGRRLANFCITLNEHPCIRFQGSSAFAREIAQALHQGLLAYKRANPTFWSNGDDAHADRERGQLLIVDRSFDPLSPLMHEYTYQAMVMDLLNVEEGQIITYSLTTNKGAEEETQALLNESDELWVEFRHSHIAKVIETVKERMTDIIQNNAGAALVKGKATDLDMSAMAAAVKKLPEFKQTMSKLSQHVAIAQQCMNQLSRQGLLNLSKVEQTVSTGFDEDGKEVKGAKLLQLVTESLRGTISKDQKVRLLAVLAVSQKNVQGGDDLINQAIQAARLTPSEQQSITNFARLVAAAPQAQAAAAAGKGGFFSSIFRGKAVVHPPTAEGEYVDTRHVTQLKTSLEQLLSNELPQDRFPAMGPSVSQAAKSEAKSVRKFGANARWAKKDNVQFVGGRTIVFIAGGVAYSEIRSAYELMQAQSKEVIIGGTHLLTPDSFLADVGGLHKASAVSPAAAAAKKREDIL